MCNQITDRCKLSGYASGGCPEIPAALLLAGGRRQPLPERRDLEHDVNGDCLEARILGHRLGELRMDRCRGLAGALGEFWWGGACRGHELTLAGGRGDQPVAAAKFRGRIDAQARYTKDNAGLLTGSLHGINFVADCVC